MLRYLSRQKVALGFALAFIVMMVVRIVRRWGDEATHEGDAGAKPGISSRPAMSAMRSCEDCLSAPQAREFRSGIARVAGRVRSSLASRLRPLACFVSRFCDSLHHSQAHALLGTPQLVQPDRPVGSAQSLYAALLPLRVPE